MRNFILIAVQWMDVQNVLMFQLHIDVIATTRYSVMNIHAYVNNLSKNIK